MVYDTIKHCKNKKNSLIIIDFTKALNMIEWSFISDALTFLNICDNFSSMTKLFQRNSLSRVEQNGHLSDSIVLSRGCRLGDPLFYLMFSYSVQRLYHMCYNSVATSEG